MKNNYTKSKLIETLAATYTKALFLLTIVFLMPALAVAQVNITITTPSTCGSPAAAPLVITGTTNGPGQKIAIYVDGIFATNITSDGSSNWSWAIPGSSVLKNTGNHTVEVYNLSGSYIANGDAQYGSSMFITNTSSPSVALWADIANGPVVNADGGLLGSGSSATNRSTTSNGRYYYSTSIFNPSLPNFTGEVDIIDMQNPLAPAVVANFCRISKRIYY